MKAIIDSSAWINFMRKGPESAPAVTAALRDARAAFCEPVWAEVWGGAKGKREEQYLIGLREACVWLAADRETWEVTYELRRTALRKGLNCPLTDVLIAACARRHGAELIHDDRHLAALLKL